MFFLIPCLIVGSSVGVDHTIDPIMNYCFLHFGSDDYIFVHETEYDEDDVEYQGDFTNVYYIRKSEKDLGGIIEQILRKSFKVYERYYQLDHMKVVYEYGLNFSIY